MMKRTKRKLGNQRGVALIWAYLCATFMITLLTGFYNVSTLNLTSFSRNSAEAQAFYLAESGLDIALANIRVGAYNDVSQPVVGIGSYTASYDEETHSIIATGTVSTVGGATIQKVLTAKVIGTQTIPPGVSGALTGPGAIELSGTVTLDGNEHTSEGVRIEGWESTGSPGIAYYLGPVTVAAGSEGTVQVGGVGIDPVPYDNGGETWDPTTLLDMPSDASNTTLNQIFGLDAASTVIYDTYRQTTAPSVPLNNGIYYYDAPTGMQVMSETINLGTPSNPGSGILIVTNANNNYKVKLVGEFKGLIVADEIILQNARITGALVTLQPSTSLITGVSPNATVLFSSAILESLPVITSASYEPNHALGDWANNANGDDRIFDASAYGGMPTG